MKRMFALLLALAMLAALLSGCGSISSAPVASADTPTEESAAAPAEDAPAAPAPEEPAEPEEAAGELHSEVYGVVEAGELHPPAKAEGEHILGNSDHGLPGADFVW